MALQGREEVRIGLDLDGVVADWVTSATKLLRDRGSEIPDLPPPYWDWLKEHARPEDWKWLWGPGMKYSYQFAEPYKGSVEFANALKKRGDVVIMTSRPKGSWTTTIQWWWDHMGYTPAGFNFFDSGLDKHQVQVDLFIEDNVEYAEDYATYDKNCSARVFLLDRSWNVNYNLSYGVERVKDYAAILERLKNEDTE